MTSQLHSVVRGSGTPLLFIHGFTVDHRILLPFDQNFAADAAWQRIYVDLPGFGRSPAIARPSSADECLRALVEFVEERIGTRRFAVMGSSFGGLMARGLVAEFGDQVIGLGMLCPVVGPLATRTLPAKNVLQSDAALLAGLEPEDARDYAAMAVIQSEENWALFRDHVLPGIRCHDREAAAELAERFDLSPAADGHDTFTGPSLLITGRQDHAVGYLDQLAFISRYPQLTSLTIDGAGHNAHFDKPMLVHAAFRDWLARME
ncbi:alpha/beta fold hydrolase [Humibacter sp. RRB41]|uniref:alpha/beta fold hydrolase n=1 Tax=Humibacter sp. RRB41 TaxID=2919946 RepID=UPI001FA9D27D|nr:alpha/beta hydrolase [Humibacter sp. RRB41]